MHHLINNGAEVNQRDEKGYTPLHRAAFLAQYDGYLELYEYLLVRCCVLYTASLPDAYHAGQICFYQLSGSTYMAELHLVSDKFVVIAVQSRGADPSIRTEDFDPYLNPGHHLPIDLACEDETVRAKLLALDKKYAKTPKVRNMQREPPCPV